MKTAKEVLTKYSDGDYTQFQGYENILMAMDEYAKQYHESRMKEIPEISDEEIKSIFTTPHYHYETGHYYKVKKDRIFGAKWYREELKKRLK